MEKLRPNNRNNHTILHLFPSNKILRTQKQTMKKLIICILLSIFAVTGYAEVKREGDTFKVEQTESTANDTQTKYIWEDKQGNKYPIFITKKGACYVKRVSKKTGKEYKYYLPKEVQTQIKQELGINE